MTDSDKAMDPRHFGRDPADIRIQINLAIRIGISGHLVEILVLPEVCSL